MQHPSSHPSQQPPPHPISKGNQFDISRQAKDSPEVIVNTNVIEGFDVLTNDFSTKSLSFFIEYLTKIKDIYGDMELTLAKDYVLVTPEGPVKKLALYNITQLGIMDLNEGKERVTVLY
jgi:hypothetical protein